MRNETCHDQDFHRDRCGEFFDCKEYDAHEESEDEYYEGGPGVWCPSCLEHYGVDTED